MWDKVKEGARRLFSLGVTTPFSAFSHSSCFVLVHFFHTTQTNKGGN
jgi:hypothetical protein